MDRVDPGVGLVRLRSPNGLGVNVFVLEADDGVALVDTGFGFTGEALTDGLTAGGYALGDVESVLLTHLHEDHVGGAIALQSRWGATVYAGDRSADVLDDWVAWYEPRVAFADWMPRQLGPSAVLDAQIAARERRVPTPLVEGPHRGLAHWQPVQVGAEVRVGAYRFVCVDARGHDPRHVAWYEPDRRWLFAGDVVLGVPTPITPLMDDDMGDYRRTLLRWSRQLDVAWLLPGHGRPSERFDRSVVLSLGFLRSIHSRVAAALRNARPAWRMVYIDPRSALLFPPAGPTRAALAPPSRLLTEGADLQLSRGFLWRRRGNLEKANSALLAAQRMDPMQLFVYGELMFVASLREDADGVRHWIEEALHVYPRRWNPIWSFAEQAWGAMGRCEEALDALRKIRLGSPFVADELRNEFQTRIRESECPPVKYTSENRGSTL